MEVWMWQFAIFLPVNLSCTYVAVSCRHRNYDKATKQAIGIAGLKEMKPSVYTVTDIALCPDFHGKGYGNQILMAFISLAFDELGATELHYDCFKQNEVSKRLALSCGFTYTHSEEAELTKDGEKVILDYYEVRK